MNHTIRTDRVPDMDVCELLCYNEPNCVSVNYETKTNNCDLNNSTHQAHDEEFVDSKGWLYHGADVSPLVLYPHILHHHHHHHHHHHNFHNYHYHHHFHHHLHHHHIIFIIIIIIIIFIISIIVFFLLFFFKGRTVIFLKGEWKFSSANNFFKLMRLCNHFLPESTFLQTIFYFFHFLRKICKLKLFLKKKLIVL